MNKKIILILTTLVLIFAIGSILYYNIVFLKNETISDHDAVMKEAEIAVDESKDNDIIEIPVDTVKGITKQEAEDLCYFVLGEKDEKTRFTFSFGTSGAIEKDIKQYYVIRASWLVNNSHLSYIGDFFVSADGKEIYSGTALSGEYVMVDRIWSE